ncbi:MAG TPA: hypothetical protein VN030_15950 [Cellvibrio sp.]|nr:hypothetical protein [Cellvibrio sp.]
MNIQSFVAALFLLVFSLSATAAPVEFEELSLSTDGVAGAGLYFKDAKMAASDYSAVSLANYVAANAGQLNFEEGQYIKLDTASSKSKNITAIEPNSVYILVLGLLSLFFVRRNQGKSKH